MIVLEALLEQALNGPYHRIFIRESDGGYSASVLELEGVFGGGETLDEANATLEDAMADWVTFEFERGNPIPPPINVEGYGGRVSLRLPPSLHYAAAVRARIENVSINRLLSDAVAQHLGSRALKFHTESFAIGVAAHLSSFVTPRLLELDTMVSDQTADGWVAFSVKGGDPPRAMTLSSYRSDHAVALGHQMGAVRA